HQTGRSSGVVHSGVYYAPGSLKAELCVRGARELQAFCEERRIPFERCGKLIVAVEPAELPRLEELRRRAAANGVAGAELVGPERLRELEPHAAGVRALHVPSTAITDFALVAQAYADDVVAAGGAVLLGREVVGLERRGGKTLVRTSGGDVEARGVVACAGVHADRVARLCGGSPEPRIVPFRGDYLVLRPERRSLVRGLVYPVPDPAFPFLGVHTTLRLDGDVWLGPNAVLAFGREAYGRFQLDARDLLDALRASGFRRLARRHWRTGTAELLRDYSRRLFVASARRLLPELSPSDVLPGPSGIRAQALASDGTLVDDFVFERQEGVLHVRNAPSPGATSSLPIGARIARTAIEAFGLGR
ncbi:MAG TPA: L-2-hydroxyglutarate oxidase, partial [Gaiellaceae bacterium]|nr:L-2-hydroxyglutarate oxidase [Gaiellaceae bacterium]